MPEVPKIELRDVHKSFGPKHVLNGLDLVVKRGESVVVIGGSAPGKRVMLKGTIGTLAPDGGQILIDGVDAPPPPPRGREPYLARIGMLFQGAALFDSLPVWENVAFKLIQGHQVLRREARDIAT